MTTSPFSYATPWVDGTRASHASAARRTLGALTRVVTFDALTGALAARPLGRVTHVLPAPDGSHVVVQGADAAWIFDMNGAHIGSIPRSTGDGLTFVTSGGVFRNLEEHDWKGDRATHEIFLPIGRAGRVWATYVNGTTAVVVNQQAIEGNHASRTPEQIVVVANHLVAGSLADKLIGASVLPATWGMGAITRKGEAVVLTTGGDLHVYAHEANDELSLKQLHASHVPLAGYDVSIVNGALAVLVAAGVPNVDDAEWHGPYQGATDLFTRFDQLGGAHWKTHLHLVSLTGTVGAPLAVPFEVLQPPVDGGGGRIYLAGNGFAAVQDGKLLWSQAPTARTLVAAFAGGEVALTIGKELRIVERDGHIGQTFATAGEAITTPPAIAPDGSVWLATEKAIYAAR